VYINREVGSRSCNCFNLVKEINITISENMFVAIIIQLEMCIRHIVIWGLSGSTMIF
jgi:hypothetical protein